MTTDLHGRIIPMTIFEDLGDVVTSDTFFTVLGTALTAGSYGYVTGLLDLTGLEQTAAQEAMKGIAGMAGGAAQNYVRTGRVVVPGFLEGWQGQMAYRTKKMIVVGGPGFASAALATLATYVDPAVLETFKDGYDRYKDVERQAKSVPEIEAAKKRYLGELEASCLAQTAGPINPSGPRTVCRPDMLAQAANLAAGETVFDTEDWDPATGRPVKRFGKATNRSPISSRTYTAADLERIWREAAARGMPEGIVRALRLRYEAAAATKQPDLSRAVERVDLLVGVAPPPTTKKPRGLAEDLLLVGLLTSPVWGYLWLWPLLKKSHVVGSARKR